MFWWLLAEDNFGLEGKARSLHFRSSPKAKYLREPSGNQGRQRGRVALRVGRAPRQRPPVSATAEKADSLALSANTVPLAGFVDIL